MTELRIVCGQEGGAGAGTAAKGLPSSFWPEGRNQTPTGIDGAGDSQTTNFCCAWSVNSFSFAKLGSSQGHRSGLHVTERSGVLGVAENPT